MRSSKEIERELSLNGISPVVVLDNADDAVPLAKALLKGGVWFMEITLRTDAAIESIRRVAKEVPEMIVGAGTVINLETCKAALEAGSEFIVCPGYNHEVVEYCKEKDLNPRIDKTNFENIYTRNKIRNLLIPYIEENFNPNIIESLKTAWSEISNNNV